MTDSVIPQLGFCLYSRQNPARFAPNPDCLSRELDSPPIPRGQSQPSIFCITRFDGRYVRLATQYPIFMPRSRRGLGRLCAVFYCAAVQPRPPSLHLHESYDRDHQCREHGNALRKCTTLIKNWEKTNLSNVKINGDGRMFYAGDDQRDDGQRDIIVLANQIAPRINNGHCGGCRRLIAALSTQGLLLSSPLRCPMTIEEGFVPTPSRRSCSQQ